MHSCQLSAPFALTSSPRVRQAIGYGMLISVLGRNRGDFDGLLAFYHMFTNQQGLMNWQLLRRRDGEVHHVRSFAFSQHPPPLTGSANLPCAVLPARVHVCLALIFLNTLQIVFNPNGGESSATDGDMDAAFALFLAATFWDEPAYRIAGVRVCAALYAGCFNKSTHVRTSAPAICEIACSQAG